MRPWAGHTGQLWPGFIEVLPAEVAGSEFQSAMISGIALVLEPNPSNAEILHTILDTFLADREAAAEHDPTSRREVRIIRFLKNKAISVQDGTTTAMQIDPGLEAKQHADLLLGLQQGQSANPSPMTRVGLLPGPASFGGSIGARASFYNNARSPAYQLSPGKDGMGSNHTGSPIEDDSAAQHLFDRWCATMGGDASGQFTDPVLMQWQAGQEPFSAFVSQPYNMESDPTSTISTNGGDGPDGFFWENLISQIRPETRAQD